MKNRVVRNLCLSMVVLLIASCQSFQRSNQSIDEPNDEPEFGPNDGPVEIYSHSKSGFKRAILRGENPGIYMGWKWRVQIYTRLSGIVLKTDSWTWIQEGNSRDGNRLIAQELFTSKEDNDSHPRVQKLRRNTDIVHLRYRPGARISVIRPICFTFKAKHNDTDYAHESCDSILFGEQDE